MKKTVTLYFRNVHIDVEGNYTKGQRDSLGSADTACEGIPESFEITKVYAGQADITDICDFYHDDIAERAIRMLH
jgi:hypothetical protein